MVENGSKFVPKNPNKFVCLNCDYLTSNSKDYKKHLQTIKHKSMENDSEMVENLSEISPKIPIIYTCICGKKYKYDSGYYRHKKKCETYLIQENNPSDLEVSLKYQEKLDHLTNVVLDIVKQNNELTKQIVELSSKTSTNNYTNVNTSNNSHNKTFNLQFFLNEQCKDAINIKDFVESIQVQISDLENTGRNGYVEGISKIIIDNLKMLDITERPVHCSDFKRDVLYVKDSDKWERESDNYTKIKKVINCITDKNISLIPKWKKENPDCLNSNSNKSTQINKIIMQTMETDSNKKDKIIKNIAKEVVIDKN